MAIDYAALNTVGALSNIDYNQQSVLEKSANFVAATLVDVGTSLWNSVTPESWEASTTGILQDLGATGAVAAYEMNQDTIQTLSFVGGLFIPGLAATKIAAGVRAGLKGTSWLSDARKLEDMSKFNGLIADGLQGTQQYKAVRNSIYMRGQAANLMDVAAAELAIAGTLNAHPMMETYWEDPVENFAIGMLIGGGIGAGISGLMTKATLKSAAGAVEGAAVATVSKEAAYQAPVLADAASSITALDIAAQRLEKLTTSTDVNQLTRDTAKSWALSMREQQGALFSEAASPAIRVLASTDEGKVALDGIRSQLKDTKFFGVDKVDFYKPESKGFSLGLPFNLNPLPAFQRTVKTGPNAGKEKFVGRQIYSQELKGFVSPTNAAKIANVADTQTLGSIEAAAKRLTTIRTRNDFDPLLATSDLEASFLANIRHFEQAPADMVAKASIVAGDLPAMNGWLAGYKAKTTELKAAFATGGADAAKLKELQALSEAKLTVTTPTGKVLLTPEQAQVMYLHETGMRINQAVREGVPREAAALRFNTTPAMVDLAVSKPDGLVGLYWSAEADKVLPQIVRWNNGGQLKDALSPSRRLLAVSASEQRMTGEAGALLQAQHNAIKTSQELSTAQKAALENGDSLAAERIASKLASLDEQYSTISRMWIESSVLNSKSQMLAAMQRDVVDATELKVLREGINQMVNGKGGNPFYQSADFVTSTMGQVGRLVTAIGDKRAHLANMEFERIATPISTSFKKILQDPAARTEFALADNFRQSTRGMLKYDEASRSFVTKDEAGKWIPAGGPTIASQTVHEAMVALDAGGSAILDTQRTINRIKGKAPPQDIGTWIPSVALKDKHRGFVVNNDDGTIKMLVANTADDLKSLMGEYKAQANETLMTAAEVGSSKIANMSDELIEQVITSADVGKLKKGIGLAAPDVSGDRLADIINGLRDRVNYQATAFVETSLHDVMQKLDYMSSMNQSYAKAQGSKTFLGAVKQLQVQDTAADMKDLLLGKNPAHRNQMMSLLNGATNATVQVGINAFSKAWELVKPTFSAKGLQGDYDGFMNGLRAQGIEDPFKVFNEAARPLLLARAKNSGYSVDPTRLINGGNAIAASLALRFMELAQPLVNMMSLPILSISTISRSYKMAQMTGASDLVASNPLAVMSGGMRRAHSSLPENQAFLKMFKEEGLLDPILSEADEVLKLSRFGSGGVVGGVEKLLDSTFMKIMSKPSDISESLVRKYSLMTGVEMGRRLYGPNASQRQIAMFARDFMKQSVGNYSTSQRPMMFQGTLGAAMGLFQTYMLTYAQNMYRHVELQDYKGLGKTMLAQAGIFGAGSLPGFQPISQAIGEHYSDEHWDLVSGTYRALPDKMADFLIYGLPSNIAPAVHTRGDVNPRIPGGVTTMVAPSMVMQAMDTMFAAGKALGQLDANSGQAFLEALSMQSVSRPLARVSELVTGTAITRQGKQVAGEEEVWSAQGIIARVLSTRTLQEAKLREATHLNSYYGAIDNEARQGVVQQLKTSIRAGTLDAERMDELAYSYLRTGSPQGFRQAVNNAFMEDQNPGLMDLTNKLRSSPLMNILEDID